MHRLISKQHAPVRTQSGSAAGPVTSPAGKPVPQTFTDSHADWPTHRLRWCLSMLEPPNRSAER